MKNKQYVQVSLIEYALLEMDRRQPPYMAWYSDEPGFPPILWNRIDNISYYSNTI